MFGAKTPAKKTTAPSSTDFVMPRGDQNSPLAMVGYSPTETDQKKGYAFAGTDGWFLDSMLKEAQLPLPYFMTLQPVFGQKFPDDICLQGLLKGLEQVRPPFIITCDSRKEKGERFTSDVLGLLVPETKGNLSKYAGSLLTSPLISWPHYVMAIQSPTYIMSDYAERDITVSLDLGKMREEVNYYFMHSKTHQPLPERELICEPDFPTLLDFLCSTCLSAKYLGADIETIRPVKHTTPAAKKKYLANGGHFNDFPGIPYTLSLAPSKKLGIAFSLWDYTYDELVQIYRLLDRIFREVQIIGQNFFLFDTVFLEAMGFRLTIRQLQDLIINHHVLWPELPHSLQFQTRQYTRQPYYKDEGKHWKPSQKRSLLHYNCLDSTVTVECYEGQLEEFAGRPHLGRDDEITRWFARFPCLNAV